MTFSDVSTSHPYYKAILWANEKGIAKGYNNGTFKPDDPCTRGHIVTFLWRYKASPAPKTGAVSFTDVPAAHVYYNSIKWASSYSIALGFSDGSFRPDAVCTRGQCVTFLYRAAQNLGQGVVIHATKVSVGSTLTLYVGSSETLTVTITPADTTDKLTFTSSKTMVATVSSNGTVKAVAAGTATITVKASGGKTATVAVTVKANSSGGSSSGGSSSGTPGSGTKWVLNTSTKKIHYPSCASAAKIAAQNRATTNATVASLLKQGYSCCKNCNPHD